MPALLTLETLRSEAIVFTKAESKYPEPSHFGVTDGKAVGTYLEHKFQADWVPDNFQRAAVATSVRPSD